MQCGQCSFVCPHSVIRAKYFDESRLEGAPAGFKSAPVNARGYPGCALQPAILCRGLHRMRAVRRGLPGAEPARAGRQGDQHGAESASGRAGAGATSPSSRRLPVNDRARVDFANVRGVQFLRAAVRVFRRLRRMRRDALSQAALATLRRPDDGRECHRLLLDLWRQSPCDAVDENQEGRGPAWSNSLFEDNAEFGLGFRLAADKHLRSGGALLKSLSAEAWRALVTLDPGAHRRSGNRRSAPSASASPN